MFRLSTNLIPALCREILKTNRISQVARITSSVHNLQLEHKIEDTVDNSVSLEDKQQPELQHKDVPTLLKGAIDNEKTQNSFQTLEKIYSWTQEKKVNYKRDVECNEFYPKFLALLEKRTIGRDPRTVLNALEMLLKLGVPSGNHLIESMETEVLWNVRKVSITLLLQIMTFQINYQKTELQKKVLKETLLTIQRRWVEIKSPAAINTILNHHNLFSLDFLGRIDDQTIEVAETMSAEDLCRTFCHLGNSKRRAAPVLRALAFHIAKHTDTLTPRQLANLLYAMNTLSFPDQVLLDRIASDLISQVAEIERPAIVGNIFTCMGQLRWRNTSLVEVLSEWVEKNLDLCRINDLASFIQTLATISYTPTNSEMLYNAIIPKLNQEDVPRETVWLDIVWSLVTLGIASTEHIASILSSKFINKLPSSTASDHLRMGLRLKLLNINAHAQHLMKEAYSGPTLNLAENKDVIVMQTRSEIKLTKHVQQNLYNFLPPPKYLLENIQTSMGVYVDVELSVDKDGTPIPIQDYTTHFGESESLKPLPDGAFRVALFVWDYKDYTIGTQELLGFNQQAVKLVESVGYKVVNIPYYEYNMRNKTLKNVQYLEKKIKEII
ncbi:unnamed protein product [Meganyctiphanes norvegica]|uniref:RAP domain-containing protein n=1 Tax=Meganyctiphanes norvegica TaxID=48144 RepID=A0AAV2PYD9_MEGNR